MELPYETKRELPHDPAIPLPGICAEKMKTLIWKGTYTPVFIEALFIIAQDMETTQVAATHNWDLEGVANMYTMEIYSAIKRIKYFHLQQHGWT